MQCGLATSRADGTGCLEKLAGVLRRHIIATAHEHIRDPLALLKPGVVILIINPEYIAV
jgi:hypothetical protein